MKQHTKARAWSLLLAAGMLIPVASIALASGSPAEIPSNSIQQAVPALPGFAVTATNQPTATAGQTSTTAQILAFVEVPAGALTEKYVILTAVDLQAATSSTITLSGTLNNDPFTCAGSPCKLPISGTSLVIFHATSSSGATSAEIQATVREYIGADGGDYLAIDAVNQVFLFADSCANMWNLHETNPQWADFPQIPTRLNTSKDLYYLARRLILNGIVDTRSCADGGMNGSFPSTCGMELASGQMTIWQNQYDFAIWEAARSKGIPPRIIKTLVEVESQFWPSNDRMYVDEIGLGQANQLGMDVLLRQNPALYQQVCSTVFPSCFTPFGQLSPSAQAMLRGALIKYFDASCPTCDYGIDLDKADQSIDYIALALQANCSQVKLVLDSYDVITGYEDAWKFTLVSYHSGIGCLLDGFKTTDNRSQYFNWTNVSNNFNCVGAKDYVDKFWTSLTSFDQNMLQPQTVDLPYSAVVVPPPTPTPEPTPALSGSRLFISVFYDKNGNGVMNQGEGLNDISVEVRLENGAVLTGRTANGYLIFDMRRFPTGVKGTVSLTGLYREISFTLPRQGIVPAVFIFDQPILPTVLP